MSSKRKPSPDARVLALAQAAVLLTDAQRAELVTLINAMGARSPHFIALNLAFEAVCRQPLTWVGRGSAMDKQIANVCRIMEDMEFGTADKRAEHAVLCAVLEAARSYCKKHNDELITKQLLHVLETVGWRELLDQHFPGYGMQLLGSILCRRSLTGSASFASSG